MQVSMLAVFFTPGEAAGNVEALTADLRGLQEKTRELTARVRSH